MTLKQKIFHNFGKQLVDNVSSFRFFFVERVAPQWHNLWQFHGRTVPVLVFNELNSSDLSVLTGGVAINFDNLQKIV